MEDNLHHNNKLEEFLRRSLKEHSEAPPADLWSKISSELEPPAAMPTEAVVRQMRPVRRWRIVAAAAVAVGLLIGQHLYFNGKINQLSRDLEQNATQLKQLEQQKLTEQSTNFEQSGMAGKEALAGPQSAQGSEAAAGGDKAGATAPAKHAAQSEAEAGRAVAQAPKTKPQLLKNKPEPGAPSGKAQAPAAGNAAENIAQQNNTSKEEAILDNAPQKTDNQSVVVASQTTGLEKIWLKRLLPLEAAVAQQAPFVQADLAITPVKTPRFSIGLNAMPMLTKRSINRIKPRDNGGGPGGPIGPIDEKSFNVDKETSASSWMAGVALETALTPRLKLGVGANYRSMDFKTTHEVRFDFDDRRGHHPHHGGQGDDDFEFQYVLNTAAGTVEMDVRATSADPTQTIADDEKVEASIQTSQRLTYLSVPVYANYSLGNGRLRMVAKAGLLFNMMLDNDFQVGEINPLNDKFAFKRDKPRSGAPADLQTVSAEYIAGLGLEYRMNNALSLRVEPTVTGSLTGLHNNPYIDSNEFSAGINMGLMYSF